MMPKRQGRSKMDNECDHVLLPLDHLHQHHTTLVVQDISTFTVLDGTNQDICDFESDSKENMKCGRSCYHDPNVKIIFRQRH
jgi:hypothetical protein